MASFGAANLASFGAASLASFWTNCGISSRQLFPENVSRRRFFGFVTRTPPNIDALAHVTIQTFFAFAFHACLNAVFVSADHQIETASATLLQSGLNSFVFAVKFSSSIDIQ